MIFGIGGERVGIERSLIDDFGDRTWTPRGYIYDCVFAPRTSEEANSQRTATVTTGLTMYAPPGAVISPHDRIIRTDGEKWEVDGDPGTWKNPIGGSVEGVQVQLKRVTG